MYNESIKVANKIITSDDLLEIFSMMNEKLKYYQKISNTEAMQNKMLEYSYQKWSFKDNGSSLVFTVNFYDDTSIKFDNYENFIGIFNSRLDEIKDIYVRFYLTYDVKNEYDKNYYHESIIMWIYENKMNIDVSLDSKNKKMDDVFELIKNKVLTAQPKYDDVIKNKNLITFKVGLSLGLIPGLIITTLLLIIPIVREVFSNTFVLYPICVLILAFFIGFTIGNNILSSLYSKISPEKKYAYYDTSKGKSVYKDDIDQFVGTSEILIGKNADNLICRRKIIEIHDKYKGYILPEIGILIVLSIIVLFF